MSLSAQRFAFQQNRHSLSVIPIPRLRERELFKRNESTQTTGNFTFCDSLTVNENRGKRRLTLFPCAVPSHARRGRDDTRGVEHFDFRIRGGSIGEVCMKGG